MIEICTEVGLRLSIYSTQHHRAPPPPPPPPPLPLAHPSPAPIADNILGDVTGFNSTGGPLGFRVKCERPRYRPSLTFTPVHFNSIDFIVLRHAIRSCRFGYCLSACRVGRSVYLYLPTKRPHFLQGAYPKSNPTRLYNL